MVSNILGAMVLKVASRYININSSKLEPGKLQTYSAELNLAFKSCG